MAPFFLSDIFNPQEDEIEFESFIKFSIFLFRFFRFNFDPLAENADLKDKLKHFAKICYFRIVLMSLAVAIAGMVTFGIVHIENFNLAGITVANSSAILLILLKGVSTHWYKQDIWDIFQQLKAIFSQRLDRNVTSTIKKHLDDYHKVIKIYSIPFAVVTLPITLPIIPFIMNGTQKLPVTYWYPFDETCAKFYPIALFWVNWIGYNATAMLLAADSLLFGLISAIVMEFDLLTDELMRIKLVLVTERYSKMKELVDRHNMLLDLCDKLQKIYQLTFLFSFGISSLIFCFILFKLSITAPGERVEAYSFFVPYLGMMVGQVFLICFFGQRLIDASLAVADGVYNCGWEEIFDVKFRKQLLLVIIRAQKPKTLTAMGFADISLPSFTSILTKAGSYFSLLQNVYGE